MAWFALHWCRPREGGDPYAAASQFRRGVWVLALAPRARPGRQRKDSLTKRGRAGPSRVMRPALAALAFLACAAPALAITGHAPPASGAFARSIVMLVD